MKKRKLLLALVAGFALSSCSIQDLMFWKKKDNQQQSADSVVSVSVSCPVSEVFLGNAPVTCSASVESTGNASKEVTWSSSSSAIATVSSTGSVTFVGGGTVTITATSKQDTSKSGSVQIKVISVDRPDLIAEGYLYSETFPYAQAKAFTGKDVVGFESDSGFYFKTNAATSEAVAYFKVIVADSDANYNAIWEATEASTYYYFYDTYYNTDAFIDETKTFEMDFYEYYATDAEDDLEYVINLDFYKCADIYETSTPTTLTAWDATTSGYIAQFGVELPFVKLGKEFESYFDEDDFELSICDYCCDFNKLDGYRALLLADEWVEKGSASSGYYYEKVNGDYTIAVVEFYFAGAYGNYITLYQDLRQLDNYPGTEVTTYVTDEIKSIYSVPAFAGSGNVKYTYYEGEESITVGALYATQAECDAYISSLVSDGYVLNTASAIDCEDGVSYAELSKGKITVGATINYATRDANATEISQMLTALAAYQGVDLDTLSDDEYYEYVALYLQYIEYETYGTFAVYDYETVKSASIEIWGDQSVHEVPGLYVVSDSINVSLTSPVKIEVEQFELGAETLEVSFVSSDIEVATVAADGTVSGVAVGECDVTATVTYLGDDYSVTVHVEVVSTVTDSITLAKLFSTSIKTTYTNFSGKKDVSDAVYAGQCAGGDNDDVIQIRSKNSNSGIYSSTSGGRIVSVTLHFSSADTQSSGVKIVASNTAFSSTSDLFSATVVATLNKDNPSYEFVDSYQYVGVISAGGAHYFDSIDFVWEA